MNRRSILAAGLALLSTSALAQRGPRRAEIPHSELAWLWDTARASPNLDALRDTVGGRFGPLPWVFVDTIRTGSEPDGTPLYERAVVRVNEFQQDPVGLILGTPTIIAAVDIVEPARLSPGPRRVRLPFRGHR